MGQYVTENGLAWNQGEVEVFFGIRHIFIGAINATIDETCILDGAVDASRMRRIIQFGCAGQVGDLLFADGLE
jgi:hypothetical protein